MLVNGTHVNKRLPHARGGEPEIKQPLVRLSNDFPLAAMYAGARTLKIADGPDEVHKMAIARRELHRYQPQEEPVAS